MLILIIIVSLYEVKGSLYYDSYRGVPITFDQLKQHDKANTTFWCVNELEPCNPYEGRRVDGSCNNMKYPTRGATHTPFTRILPPVFDTNFEPKKTAAGNKMPLARYARTRFTAVGKVPSLIFTQLATYGLVFLSADVVSLHDTVNYIVWRPYCCAPKGKTDPMCVPNSIPEDDPVHRFSGHRCLNMTRPETFQSVGCVPKQTTPERIISSTPLIDLSILYGNSLKSLQEKGRLYQGGLLKYEVENGRIWPPSTKSQINLCLLNEKPYETRCHGTPEDGLNTLAGINLMGIWFWRYHNHIATQLARLNPCWSDEMLFNTAREINIAVVLQIYYYELLPIFLGRDNMVHDGVITENGEFRDNYDENILPQLSLEFPFVMRWAHTIQESTMKMYDKDGYYMKKYPMVNLTLKTGYFGLDNNLDYLTQGSFRQPGANVDYVVDPDITELGLGPHQKVSDVMSNDLSKNRYFGFQPYTKYKEVCSGVKVCSFDDLKDSIDQERIEILKDVYESFEDIDLLAGIWLERPIYGGIVPPTFYCLVIDQLKRNIKADRHWYERPNRVNAFTPYQLSEIRKIKIARVLCDVGDTVTSIQPNAFLRAGIKNKMCSCEEIEGINYGAWKDSHCDNPIYWYEYNK